MKVIVPLKVGEETTDEEIYTYCFIRIQIHIAEETETITPQPTTWILIIKANEMHYFSSLFW